MCACALRHQPREALGVSCRSCWGRVRYSLLRPFVLIFKTWSKGFALCVVRAYRYADICTKEHDAEVPGISSVLQHTASIACHSCINQSTRKPSPVGTLPEADERCNPQLLPKQHCSSRNLTILVWTLNGSRQIRSASIASRGYTALLNEGGEQPHCVPVQRILDCG